MFVEPGMCRVCLQLIPQRDGTRSRLVGPQGSGVRKIEKIVVDILGIARYFAPPNGFFVLCISNPSRLARVSPDILSGVLGGGFNRCKARAVGASLVAFGLWHGRNQGSDSHRKA